MRRPEDIPQDIWRAAIVCAETALRNLDGDYGDMAIEITAIARAIMAERAKRENMRQISQFLIERLDDFERDALQEDDAEYHLRQFAGHVSPAIESLRDLIADVIVEQSASNLGRGKP